MISRSRKYICLSALIVAASSVAMGDTVNVVGATSSNIWQTWNASQVSNVAWQQSQAVANQPYWNNGSWDGSNDNIGGCLAVKTASCALPNQPGAIPYLGQANGNAFTNFYFTNTGGGTVTLDARYAADSPNEVFGWYNINNPGQYQILVSGTTMVDQTVSFNPSAQYGLFFYNGTSGVNDLFMTDSDLNASVTNLFGCNPTYQGSVDPDIQHFAVFQQTAGTYYVGIEDLPTSGSDMDYNDMIVKLSTSATPEPGSMLLLGAGLIGLSAIRFRRKKAKK